MDRDEPAVTLDRGSQPDAVAVTSPIETSDTSQVAGVTQPSVGLSLAIAAGALAAGLLDAYALGFASSNDHRYGWASVVAAVPVAFGLAWWARRRPAGAVLGALGLVATSAAIVVLAGGSAIPPPLLVGAGAVVAIGAAGLVAGRVRPREIVEGLLIAWTAAIFIFEVGILLHAA